MHVQMYVLLRAILQEDGIDVQGTIAIITDDKDDPMHPRAGFSWDV